MIRGGDGPPLERNPPRSVIREGGLARLMTMEFETSVDAQQRDTKPQLTGDRIRLFALIVLTIILIGLTVSLFAPFMPAITWAVALAILSWPLYRQIVRVVKRPGLAAGLSTAVVAAVILATGLFVAYQVASEAAAAAEGLDEGAADRFRDKLVAIPVLGRGVVIMEKVGLDLEQSARAVVEASAQGASGLAQGSLMAVIQFLVSMFVLYYLFRDRGAFTERLRELLPLSRGESDYLMARAADSVHATLYSTIVTSVIDSVAFGLVFWATGVPAPVLWAVIIFFLCLLPVLGAGLIWVPAAAYLAMNGEWLGFGGLIGVGVATAIFVDNILYAKLAGDRMRMHDVPVLVAFLGGLAVFGVSGMILGPAILAITEALLEAWKRRIAGEKGVAPSPKGREIAGAIPSI